MNNLITLGISFIVTTLIVIAAIILDPLDLRYPNEHRCNITNIYSQDFCWDYDNPFQDKQTRYYLVIDTARNDDGERYVKFLNREADVSLVYVSSEEEIKFLKRGKFNFLRKATHQDSVFFNLVNK